MNNGQFVFAILCGGKRGKSASAPRLIICFMQGVSSHEQLTLRGRKWGFSVGVWWQQREQALGRSVGSTVRRYPQRAGWGKEEDPRWSGAASRHKRRREQSVKLQEVFSHLRVKWLLANWNSVSGAQVSEMKNKTCLGWWSVLPSRMLC